MCRLLAEQISQIPERFDAENKSTALILKEAGFPQRRSDLSVEEVEDVFRRSPQLTGCDAAVSNDLPAAGASNVKTVLIVFRALPTDMAKSNTTDFAHVRCS